MTKKELIDEARELGCKSVTIDNITYEIGSLPKEAGPVLEAEAEALVNPMSALDDLSPEEVLYWSSPFYDELQKQKELRLQQLKEEQHG